MQIRRVGEGEIKWVWWFVAAVSEVESVGQHEKHKFEAEFHTYDTVLEKLTSKDDRELVRKSVELVKSSPGGQWSISQYLTENQRAPNHRRRQMPGTRGLNADAALSNLARHSTS